MTETPNPDADRKKPRDAVPLIIMGVIVLAVIAIAIYGPQT